MGLTIKELIPVGEKILADAGVEDYKIDAEALLGYRIAFDKQKIFMNWTYEVDDLRCEDYFDLLRRRAGGEPLQYITGEQYFFGHRLHVNPSVLIPRPETELLAEKAISYLNKREGAKTVLDLCTGSGAISISIAKACPRLKVTASDVSEEALSVARRNALDLGVSGRVEFINSDLFGSIKRGAFGRKYDLIATNPPYIKSGTLMSLQREIRDHEPMTALDGGEDGLDFYRRIAADAQAYMRKNSCLMAEIGCDQAQDVSAILGAAGFRNIEISRDLSGLDRIITAFPSF